MGLLPSTGSNTFQTTSGNAGVGQSGILASVQPTKAELATAPFLQPGAPAVTGSRAVTTGVSSGANTGSGATTNSSDVAAQQAADQAAQQQALFDSQLGTIDSSSDLSAGTSAGDLRTSINDFVDSLGANQVARNNQEVQNYLAKQQGNQGVLDMVGQGIRSGGVTLNNDNAGDSSATGAIANAYGTLGRSQATSVGDQFAQAENTVQQGHDADAVALANKLRDLPQSQTDIVNNIVSAAQQQLGNLDYQMSITGAPERVDMQAQKDQITNDTLAKLQGLDQLLSSGGGTALTPQDNSVTANKAGALFTAGTAPASAFNFNTIVPTQLQGTGASPSELPIYTAPSNKNQSNSAIPVTA